MILKSLSISVKEKKKKKKAASFSQVKFISISVAISKLSARHIMSDLKYSLSCILPQNFLLIYFLYFKLCHHRDSSTACFIFENNNPLICMQSRNQNSLFCSSVNCVQDIQKPFIHFLDPFHCIRSNISLSQTIFVSLKS